MTVNRDLERLPASASVEQVRTAVERDGGVIIKGLFCDEVGGLNAEINNLVPGYKVGIEGNEFMREFAGRGRSGLPSWSTGVPISGRICSIIGVCLNTSILSC
ncbi:hypothetical protein ACFPAA_21475 [Paraburkholderia caffeinitolerans]